MCTYITCQQYSFTSSIPDEVIEKAEEVENIIREEYINLDTGKKEILEYDANAPRWEYDTEGKIIGYKGESGEVEAIREEDREMVEKFNAGVPASETVTEEVKAEEVEEITYNIEELEEDKENRCTRMRIKSSNKEYNLVRYDN